MAIMRQWPALLALAAMLPSMSVAGESAADYYVRDLPGLPKDVPGAKMHAGHIEVTPEHNGNLFFWHFENKHIANRQRTVIWLNGGPGCSSEDGALMEIGPYRVKDKDNLVANEGSWHEFANLLFVDNPVGTGFSYVDTDSFIHELDEMASQFVQFLEKWFLLFPEYDQDDLYIAGESYAGQHIPYIAKAILDRNAQKQNSGREWNLQGLLIGNGWISPKDQYDSYIPFALEKGLFKKGSDVDDQLNAMTRVCHTRLGSEPGKVDYRECEDILSKMLQFTTKGSGDKACVNMYDVRLRDEYPSCGMNWPPDLPAMTAYLRRADVLKALHVNVQRNTGWQECNNAVSTSFNARNSKPAIDLLPNLLEAMPIMLFSGAEDLICNHIGTETMISSMEWNGGKGFEVSPGNWAPRRNWTFEGEKAGFWQEARNLTYVLFHESSHMVPFDFPRRSRDMLDRFMGVDISSIGGKPTDSKLDGEKGPDTSVGGVKKPTEDETQKQLDEAKWAAYRRSGEIVLVIVIIAAVAWGWFVWRERRKRAAYQHLSATEPMNGDGVRRKQGGDLEAAAFDESELDDLHADDHTKREDDHYSIGDDSDEEYPSKGRGKMGSSSR